MSQILTATAKDQLSIRSFLVRKDDLRQTQFIDTSFDQNSLQPGQLLLKVDSFAFTANNITYAELGDRLAYWKFYPAADPAWGIIPVWGFAEVIASRHPTIAVDERIFGFLPMASRVVLQPGKVSDDAFTDASPHRAGLPAAYQRYGRVTGDPDYAPDFEAMQSLLRPLFITSFLIDDFLADEGFFGADTVILSSASSKTAFALAYQLHKRKAVTVIGLTSAGNRGFVEGLGCYDQVVTYDAIAGLPRQPAVYVDFAGSAEIRRAIHEHFGEALKYSCAVGLSHREMNPPGKGLPGPKPIFFFAPDRIVKRNKDWGPGGFDLRLVAAWRDFMRTAKGWLTVQTGGRRDVEAVYRATLEGQVRPDEGHILSLWD